MIGGVSRRVNVTQLCEKRRGMMAAGADRAATGKALEGLGGFDQMVVFEIAFPGTRCSHMWSAISCPALAAATTALGYSSQMRPGVKIVACTSCDVEEFEEAPDPHAAPKLAFGELHRGFVADTPQQHGVEVNGQVHRHPCARWVGKVLEVHMPRAIALGSVTEFLEFMLHPAGHLDLSFHF